MSKGNNTTIERLREFKWQFERPGVATYIWFAFLITLIGIAIYALIQQILHGHIITGMRDNVVWGIYIVNFIYFMGLSYAGALISGTLHLFRSKWREPVIRIAELMTVIALLIGPLFILLCIGRLDRLHYLVLFGRIQSPITWDVIAISTDIIGCFIFLYLSVLRDIAALRDFEELNIAPWRKKLYRIMSLGYSGKPEQEKKLKMATDVMAAMVIAIAIIVYSVLAWIFSVTLQPGWHSTIFGPYFVIAAVFSGTALLIILMYIMRKIYHLEHYLQKEHFVKVGVIMMVLAAFFGYFTFSDYLTKWYGSQKNDEMLIDLLLDKYFWEFIISNYLGVLIPLLVIGIPKLRTINWITFAAFVVLIALWLNRYLIVVPTLESPYLPVQDFRETWIKYSGTWIEWSLTIGGAAMFAFLFTLAIRFVPVIQATSEVEPKNSKNDEL
ncbi:MAG: polysulfide reductase NrfD [Bacteroidales bacterium]|nr:polysulfide reductase NrfD [Bacteroidales bacterium]